MESLGARLRQRREERGISLVTVATRTKIKQTLLEALERDDVSQWPTGFYRRAFIRAYAAAIDLDPDAVLREFLELYPEPPPVDVLVAMASTLDRAQGGSRPASGIRTVVGSAIGSLARLRRSPGGDDPPASDPPNENGPSATPPPPTPAVAVAAQPSHTAQEVGAPATTGGSAPPSPVEPTPATVVAKANEPDLEAVARLCTELGRAGDEFALASLLRDVARVLDAAGLIVWHWDGVSRQLRPTLVYGYSARVVAQLPALCADADNATAATFRTARACVVGEGPDAKSAVVVPLITPAGCGGVFAIELKGGGQHSKATLAIATIFAAVLAQSQLAPVDDGSASEGDYAREGLAG